MSGRRGILCLVAALLLGFVSDAARAGTFPTPVPTFHSLGLYWSPAGARADRTCGVRFVWAVAPALDVRWSDAEDQAALASSVSHGAGV